MFAFSLMLGACGQDGVEIDWTTDLGAGGLAGVTALGDLLVVAGSGTDDEFTLLGLDPSGNVLWEGELPLAPSPFLTSVDGMLDGQQFVAAGTTAGDVLDTGVLIVAYSQAGRVQWEVAFDRSTGYDTGSEVATGEDSIVVAGTTDYFEDEGPSRGFIASLNLDGTIKWTLEPLPSGGGDLALSGVDILFTGDIVVAGRSDDTPWIAQYDSAGNEVWQQSVRGRWLKGSANGVAAVPGGAVFVGSVTDVDEIPYYDTWLAVYSAQGDLAWERAIDINGGYDIASAVAVSGDRIFLTGTARLGYWSGEFAGQGETVWIDEYDPGDLSENYGTDIAVHRGSPVAVGEVGITDVWGRGRKWARRYNE